MAHSIQDAMALGELDEEEAYFVLRFAGRHGYRETMRRLDFRGPLGRLRKKVIWVGGWESPELTQWDMGWPAWRFSRHPTPVRLLGALMFFGWGEQLRLGRGYLVFSRSGARSPADWKFYWSPDGTPSHPRAKHFVGARREAAARRVREANTGEN